jgi:hypothetical protein
MPLLFDIGVEKKEEKAIFATRKKLSSVNEEQTLNYT